MYLPFAGTRLVISQIRSIPEELPAPPRAGCRVEEALATLQPQDRRVLILVVTALEGVQNCEFPTCFHLATNLMSVAMSQLQRTTNAHFHMNGIMLSPALQTSFICSLIVLFSRDPDAVRSSLAGQSGHVTEWKIRQGGKEASKGLEIGRTAVRHTKLLAESCLSRVFRGWVAHVSAGQVCS